MATILAIIHQKSTIKCVPRNEQIEAQKSWKLIEEAHSMTEWRSRKSGNHILELFVAKLKEIGLLSIISTDRNFKICQSFEKLEEIGFFRKLSVNVTIVSKSTES